MRDKTRMPERAPEDYQDIINLTHHVSKTRFHMSMLDRAAQFSPFAALAGYDAAVKETARLTDQRIELDDEVKQKLSARIALLMDNLASEPVVELTYFVPDEYKEGGAYKTVSGSVKKLDEHQRIIVLTNGTAIPLDELTEIRGELFEGLDDGTP